MTVHRRPGVVRPSRRGFILAAAIALCVIMVIIATIIANQNRTMLGFTMNSQTETLETEGASYAYSQLRGVLQGNGVPSTLGLPTPLTPTADIVGTTPQNDAKFSGKLTYVKFTDVNGPDGYATPTPASGASSVSVPNHHSAGVITASIQDDSITQKYLTVYSGNCPYAMISANSSATAKSVQSVFDYDGEDSHLSGLMASVYGAQVTITPGRLNGRAYAKNAVAGGQSGITYPNWPNPVPVPADFMTKLSAFKTSLAAGPYSHSLQDSLKDLHRALAHDFSAQATAALASEAIGPGALTVPDDPKGGKSATQATVTASSTGDTDYDTLGGTLTVGKSLRIPGQNQELNFNQVNISGDLLLEDDSVLHLTGGLQVTGTIRLGKRATLMVDGTTTANGGLAVKYSLSGSNNIGISSTFYNKGPLSISSGMSQASTTWIPIIPMPTSNPFPTNISPTYTVPGTPPTVVTVTRPNPLALDFTAEQIVDMAAVAALTPYLGSVVPAGSTTVDVPGVFITSDNSVSILGGAKAAGLFFAPSVSSMANRTVGAIWANNAASANDLRYFPYYTHAFGHSPGANTTVGAVEHHATAYGKLP